MMCWVPEVTEIDQPDKDTDNRDDLGKHVTEVVKLPLEWSFFADLRRNRFVNVANSCTIPSERDNCTRCSIYNAGTLREGS